MRKTQEDIEDARNLARLPLDILTPEEVRMAGDILFGLPHGQHGAFFKTRRSCGVGSGVYIETLHQNGVPTLSLYHDSRSGALYRLTRLDRVAEAAQRRCARAARAANEERYKARLYATASALSNEDARAILFLVEVDIPLQEPFGGDPRAPSAVWSAIASRLGYTGGQCGGYLDTPLGRVSAPGLLRVLARARPDFGTFCADIRAARAAHWAGVHANAMVSEGTKHPALLPYLRQEARRSRRDALSASRQAMPGWRQRVGRIVHAARQGVYLLAA